MKVKMTIIVETRSFDSIPTLLNEQYALASKKTKEGKIVKEDGDKITWNTEYADK